MTPTLSFLIPVFNVQDFLDECVASVLSATAPGDEIILLNDGSQDASGDMCDAWALHAPDRIRVIHQRNAGLATARNRAVAASHGDYLCFLDSDDVLCSDTLPAVRQLLAQQCPDLLTCDAILWREGHSSSTVRHSLPTDALTSGTNALRHTLQDDFLSSCCRVYHRSLLLEVGPDVFPANRYYEDNSVVPILVSNAQRVAYLPKPLFRYRIRAGSITQSHTLQRCLDQATSLAPPLNGIASLLTDSHLREMANVLAFAHVVTAIRHASAIRNVTLRDFTAIIEAGLRTLTLQGDALLEAVERSPRSQALGKHARGMVKHRLRYAFLRLLAARWKQFHARVTRRTR